MIPTVFCKKKYLCSFCPSFLMSFRSVANLFRGTLHFVLHFHFLPTISSFRPFFFFWLEILFSSLNYTTLWLFFLFSLYRRTGECPEEDLYQMGEFALDSRGLPHQRPLHGSSGWQNDPEAAGSAVGRASGTFSLDFFLPSLWSPVCMYEFKRSLVCIFLSFLFCTGNDPHNFFGSFIFFSVTFFVFGVRLCVCGGLLSLTSRLIWLRWSAFLNEMLIADVCLFLLLAKTNTRKNAHSLPGKCGQVVAVFAGTACPLGEFGIARYRGRECALDAGIDLDHYFALPGPKTHHGKEGGIKKQLLANQTINRSSTDLK